MRKTFLGMLMLGLWLGSAHAQAQVYPPTSSPVTPPSVTIINNKCGAGRLIVQVRNAPANAVLTITVETPGNVVVTIESADAPSAAGTGDARLATSTQTVTANAAGNANAQILVPQTLVGNVTVTVSGPGFSVPTTLVLAECPGGGTTPTTPTPTTPVPGQTQPTVVLNPIIVPGPTISVAPATTTTTTTTTTSTPTASAATTTTTSTVPATTRPGPNIGSGDLTATTTRPAPAIGNVAFTGSDSGRRVQIALALVLIGAVLVLAAWRRQREADA